MDRATPEPDPVRGKQIDQPLSADSWRRGHHSTLRVTRLAVVC